VAKDVPADEGELMEFAKNALIDALEKLDD
jgi:hypothetical protein